jgi:DNA-binding SARP family transcriptional activator
MTSAPPPTPRQLKLLGRVQVLTEVGGDITSEVRPRHLAALVVLSGNGGDGVSRETLIRLLWPEHDSERARNNLSQVLHGLRKVLGEDAIVATRAEVRLSREHVDSDLWRFQKALEAGRREDALAEYAGPFADGLEVAGLEDLGRWIRGRRDAIDAAHRDALEEVARSAEADGDRSQAIARWRELSLRDPVASTAAAGLIRTLAAAGDAPAALEHERRYRARLREELGRSPTRP